jgi:TRAP-type C4-dicarboxylate transport system substrate-binding protein
MKEKSLLAHTCCVCLILMVTALPFLTASGRAEAKPIELKLASFHPATGVSVHDVLEPWSKMVEKKTGGKVKFTIYPGKALLQPQEAFDGAVSGIADVSHGAAPHTPGRFPLTESISLPFLGLTSSTHATKVLWGLYKTFPEIRAEWKQAHLLWLFGWAPFQLHSKNPVRKIEDMKGMKIRIPGTFAPTIKVLGATPVTMPGSEVYPALQKGVVDGNFHDFQGFHSYREGEVTKYTTIMNLLCGVFFVAMNHDSYNRLPADIRQAIDELSGEWAALNIHAANWDKREKEYIAEAKAMTHREMIYLPDAELESAREVSRPVWDNWVADMEAKGYPGSKIVEEAVRLKDEFK